eukprot:Tamp_03856.p2 GENE.Tamp_03856~~Tamp_03856.p2  ORF type:complete len:321 (+),score=110.24 Tamp_03856:451-1413(+)
MRVASYFTEEFALEEKQRLKRHAQAGQQAEDGGAVRGEPEFIGAAGTGAQDTPAAYATRQDAQRLLNQKHVHEIEAALEEALRKADALWSEMQEEQRLNGSLRQLVVKLRTSKLEVEDRIEDYTRELENRASVKGKNAAEERRFRQLEERMKKEEARRKAEELGLDEEEEGDVGSHWLDILHVLPVLRKYSKALRKLFLRLDYTFRDSRIAESRFGSGIALYFWFYRFLIQATFFLWIVWVTFFILHLDMFLRNGRAVTLVSSFPSVLLYSSIDHTLAISYASCVVTSTLILFAFAGGKLVYELSCLLLMSPLFSQMDGR